MNEELTAGEFEAMTGLTPKALRLYAERGILLPASVDPSTGYRTYQRAQVRHGITLDLLRKAQVPITGLAAARNFDFEGRRQAIAVQRLVEDFHLDVAERIAAFNPDDFLAQTVSASAVNWVGVVIDLAVPDDIDGRVEAFSSLALDTPAVDHSLDEALSNLGARPSETVWTAVPDPTPGGGDRMLIARPTALRLKPQSRIDIETYVRSSAGVDVTVTAGTLPHRLEITFTRDQFTEPDPADEAALGHLHTLAFQHHLEQHQLTALRSTARLVVHGRSLFDGPPPVSVFDVHHR